MRTVDEFIQYVDDHKIFPKLARFMYGNYKKSMKLAEQNLMKDEIVNVVYAGNAEKSNGWVVFVTNKRILMTNIYNVNEILLENLTAVTNDLMDVTLKSYGDEFKLRTYGLSNGNKIGQLIRNAI